MELAADATAAAHDDAARDGGQDAGSRALLTARGLGKRYAGLVALSDYSLDLPEGRIHG